MIIVGGDVSTVRCYRSLRHPSSLYDPECRTFWFPSFDILKPGICFVEQRFPVLFFPFTRIEEAQHGEVKKTIVRQLPFSICRRND